MGKQNVSIAYGRPDYGGIVIGGENVGVYTLGEDWTDSAELNGLVVEASLRVHGDTDEQIQERVADLETIIQDLGNLGITFGVDVTGVASVAMAGSDLVVTATTSIFVAAHLGLAVDVADVGAFQITEVVSGTVVNCRIPAVLTAPSSASGKAVTIGKVWRRGIEADKINFFSGQGKIKQSNDAENEPGRRRYTLILSFARDATDVRGHPRLSSQAKFLNPIGGDRIIGVSGVYTASNVLGVKKTAYENYTENIDALVVDIADVFFGNGVSFGPIGEDQIDFPDDTLNLLSFQVARREITRKESQAQIDHPAITEPSLEISRPRSLTMGVNDPRATIVAVYSCRLSRAEITSVEAIPAFFDDVIYPHIVAEMEAVGSSAVCVFQINGPTFNENTYRLSATIIGTLLDSGSTIMGYSKRTSIQISQRRGHFDLKDGGEFSSIETRPGRSIIAIVSISYTELTRTAFVGAGGESRRAPGLGIFDLNAGLGNTGLQLVGGGRGDGFQSFQRIPSAPGSPASRYSGEKDIAAIGDGSWRELDLQDTEVVKTVGTDSLGVSTPALEIIRSVSRVWAWKDIKGVVGRSGARRSTGGPSNVGLQSVGGG